MDKMMVITPKGLQVECLYFGYDKGKLISQTRTLCEGDLLEVIEMGRYITGVGWFVQVLINSKETEYIRIKEIENWLEEGYSTYYLDFEIEYNILLFQLNRALDERDKGKFMEYVSRYKQFLSIKEKIKTNLLQIQ